MSRWSAAQRYSTDPELDYLSARISRFACHRGYARSEIVSAKLRRYLPLRRQADRVAQEARVKAQLAAAKLDLVTVDYLVHSVRVELDLANSRISPAGG